MINYNCDFCGDKIEEKIYSVHVEESSIRGRSMTPEEFDKDLCSKCVEKIFKS